MAEVWAQRLTELAGEFHRDHHPTRGNNNNNNNSDGGNNKKNIDKGRWILKAVRVAAEMTEDLETDEAKKRKRLSRLKQVESAAVAAGHVLGDYDEDDGDDPGGIEDGKKNGITKPRPPNDGQKQSYPISKQEDPEASDGDEENDGEAKKTDSCQPPAATRKEQRKEGAEMKKPLLRRVSTGPVDTDDDTIEIPGGTNDGNVKQYYERSRSQTQEELRAAYELSQAQRRKGADRFFTEDDTGGDSDGSGAEGRHGEPPSVPPDRDVTAPSPSSPPKTKDYEYLFDKKLTELEGKIIEDDAEIHRVALAMARAELEASIKEEEEQIARLARKQRLRAEARKSLEAVERHETATEPEAEAEFIGEEDEEVDNTNNNNIDSTYNSYNTYSSNSNSNSNSNSSSSNISNSNISNSNISNSNSNSTIINSNRKTDSSRHSITTADLGRSSFSGHDGSSSNNDSSFFSGNYHGEHGKHYSQNLTQDEEVDNTNNKNIDSTYNSYNTYNSNINSNSTIINSNRKTDSSRHSITTADLGRSSFSGHDGSSSNNDASFFSDSYHGEYGRNYTQNLTAATARVASAASAATSEITDQRKAPPPAPGSTLYNAPLTPPTSNIHATVNPPNQEPTYYTVHVPPGVYPGALFQVDVGGRRFPVTCPPNAAPGQAIRVANPATTTMPSPSPAEDGGLHYATVPMDVHPGDAFGVEIGGRSMTVRCPATAWPGKSIAFRIPSTPVISNRVLSSGTGRSSADRGGLSDPPPTTLKRDVWIPPNVLPGMPFAVDVNGQRFRVTCPPGTMPGQRIEMSFPATPTASDEDPMMGTQQQQQQQQYQPRAVGSSTYPPQSSSRPQPASVPAPPRRTERYFWVVIPDGVKPGDRFRIRVRGRDYVITCPPNVEPGQKIRMPVAVDDDDSSISGSSAASVSSGAPALPPHLRRYV